MMLQHVFRTAMRTTDVLVTGLFSPAAVAAVGLADLYARLPLRIGLGLGGGALAGVPFVAFGALAGREAIAVLGAPAGVAQMGGTYLAIVFATAPFRHVALVGARSLQGTGDTRTPMYVDVTSSLLNIAGSLVLGLGLFGAPRLEVVGVALATAAGLAVLTVGTIGVVLGTRPAAFVGLFTDDPATAGYAAGFARAYGLAAPALAVNIVLAGFFLGFSYVTGVLLNWGPTGVYAGIALFYVWSMLVVAWGFARGDWASKASTMTAERGSVEDATD
jgi:Na+-driven multidrug efflux pump